MFSGRMFSNDPDISNGILSAVTYRAIKYIGSQLSGCIVTNNALNLMFTAINVETTIYLNTDLLHLLIEKSI